MSITKKELARLTELEKRIKEIAEANGLLTTTIEFEVVTARRMIEAMAYNFPVNFSHWTFGRDYDRTRTIYDHTGHGIPYEVVWNFDTPKAFLVGNNPFTLNVLTIAHVYGHVDYFLRNRYLQHGRAFADIAEEARHSAERFREYEDKFGLEVERTMDAGMAIQWHQHPDPFHEEPDEETARTFLVKAEQEKLQYLRKQTGLGHRVDPKEIKEIETRMKALQYKTPPEPVYDILRYIIENAPRLKAWEKDVLRVIRNQARALAPNRRTKMLDEGWATYWHARIMRQLFAEGLLTAEEHGIYLDFHAKVTQSNKLDLNVYCVGPAIFEYVKARWDRGQFGREYDECTDPFKKKNWDTKAMQGDQKVLEVAAHYTDRMAVEEFFTDEFIRTMDLFVYEAQQNKETNEIEYRVIEDNPEAIRTLLKNAFCLYDLPSIAVVDGNWSDKGELFLRHDYSGRELLSSYRNGALEKVFRLWRRPVHIETVIGKQTKFFTFNGEKHFEG